MEQTYDVAILGAGFGGSLTALLLRKLGLDVVLVDRSRHPRFAIGESSTPIADLVLRDLCREYGLSRIEPLARYGTWKQSAPELNCGLKRGFSYFFHRPGEPFASDALHSRELIVAASADDEQADTHWYRPDVDRFFCEEAVAAGVTYLDLTRMETIVPPERGIPSCRYWHLAGKREGHAVRIRSRFVVDATGGASALARALQLEDRTETLKTNSWSLFAHVTHLRPWAEMLADRGVRVADHPFRCDRAAVHQILDEGWMWQLAFDNDITSVGFALDASAPSEIGWNRLLDRYPTLAEQFADCRVVAPEGGLQRTGRLQRLLSPVAGADWCLLPHTAGFIDPLHSSGIAQTLCGIERLAGIIREHWETDGFGPALAEYGRIILEELGFIDRLVRGCYLSRRHPRLFISFSMLYFAAATTYEDRRLKQRHPPGASMLCADDPELSRIVTTSLRELESLLGNETLDERQITAFEATVAERIAPFNHTGLCDPRSRNMYCCTP